ncbi:hypothetical protein C7S15_2517 [Burkholderia cepacia]|nr:hypothetical protein [Burkholderia cepacia]
MRVSIAIPLRLIGKLNNPHCDMRFLEASQATHKISFRTAVF